MTKKGIIELRVCKLPKFPLRSVLRSLLLRWNQAIAYHTVCKQEVLTYVLWRAQCLCLPHPDESSACRNGSSHLFQVMWLPSPLPAFLPLSALFDLTFSLSATLSLGYRVSLKLTSLKNKVSYDQKSWNLFPMVLLFQCLLGCKALKTKGGSGEIKVDTNGLGHHAC